MARADRYYVHHVYAVDPAPPFAIRRIGPSFRFPTFFGGTDRDAVQFCAGLAYGEDRGELLISYGVADCVSMLIAKPQDDLFGVNLTSWSHGRRMKKR